MVGDHIRAMKGGRWNHAIDCGDETVIHLPDDGAPPRVRRSYRPEFVAAAGAVEVVTHRERTFPANQIVARAYSRIADPALASMFRDSEAFAAWCVTGRLPGASPNVAVAIPGSPAPIEPPPPAGVAAPVAPARRKRAAARKAKAARGAKGGGHRKAAVGVKARRRAGPRGAKSGKKTGRSRTVAKTRKVKRGAKAPKLPAAKKRRRG